MTIRTPIAIDWALDLAALSPYRDILHGVRRDDYELVRRTLR